MTTDRRGFLGGLLALPFVRLLAPSAPAYTPLRTMAIPLTVTGPPDPLEPLIERYYFTKSPLIEYAKRCGGKPLFERLTYEGKEIRAGQYACAGEHEPVTFHGHPICTERWDPTKERA